MKHLGLVLAVSVALLFLASPALADDTSIASSGGTVVPMTSTTIRMAAETVQCICYQRFAEYRVDFRFENSGASTSVKLGFPFYGATDSEGDAMPEAAFRAWRDGVELPVTLVHGRDGAEPTDYYVHTVDFPSGATTVTVDYLVAPTSSVIGESYAKVAAGTPYAGSSGELNSYTYTLHTGANWAGPIGTAVLRWTLAPDFVGWGTPNARNVERDMDEEVADSVDLPFLRQRWAIEDTFTQPAARTYQWVFKGIEPTETADAASAYDIGLHYIKPGEWDSNDQPTRFAAPDVTATSWLKLGDYEYQPYQVADGDASTAWAESASGPGIGQHLDFALATSQHIGEVRVVSGYAKRPDLFAKYNRPKRIRVDYSDGSSQAIELANTPSLQRFPANATAKSARVTILDVYRGSVRNETYISEIEFGTTASPKFVSFAELLQASSPGSEAASTGASAARAAAQARVALAAAAAVRPAQTIPPLLLAVLGVALVGVTAVMWRQA